MKIKYLLPCACGREIPVESGQAGQTVRCECGAESEVPTLMRMSSLKRAEGVPPAARSPGRWGARQRRLLLGAVIALPSLILAGYLFWTRPKSEEMILTHAPLDSLTVSQVWQIWQDLQSGIERRPFMAETAYKEMAKIRLQWIGASLAVCGVGLLIMASSLLVSNRQRRKPPPA